MQSFWLGVTAFIARPNYFELKHVPLCKRVNFALVFHHDWGRAYVPISLFFLIVGFGKHKK